ncbi:radical SAM protein [Brevibacillus humidisoli]|uniref:coproporphyrinogen-III oxidase family protein n=1 Tax=Brevibacillus humidisoli TaxID=2895522 RepID=UPI001E45BC03|nr:radical SAM protein [Brevibacillus humidisoli]UFJ38856.1 radical SAM protein [Brevibacillus humidisoli]
MNFDRMSAYYPVQPLLWNFLYPFFGEGSHERAQERVKAYIVDSPTKIQPGKNAIYLHIPFCDTICSFCPFIKSTKYEPIIGQYVDMLIREMEMIASSPVVQSLTFDVVFVGGGSPSVLTPDLIAKLSAAIKRNFTLAEDYEWTFECEAKSADEERVAAMVEGGANRGSFGVQTMNQHYRKMFNLTASYDEIYQTVETMGRYFQAYNLDLLYHLPGQSMEELMLDLKQVMALGTTSIDTYPLEYIVCAKGWLGKINRGILSQPPSPYEKIKYNQTVYDYLEQSGWTQKYVYTFMAPGHQQKRFKYGEVIYGGYEDQCIGFGTGAISYMQGICWGNEGDTKTYMQKLEAGELAVSRARSYHAYERKLVFFPKTMEIKKSYLKAFPIKDELLNKLDTMVDRGIVVENEDTYILHREARPWYQALLVDLIPESERPYYNRAVKSMQEELNWYEPVRVEV